MKEKVVNQDVIMSQLSAVIDWLEGLGVKGHNTRYSRYDAVVSAFFKTKNPPTEEQRRQNLVSDEMQQLGRDMSHAIRECIDISLVHQCFSGVTHKGLIEKLERVIAGQDVPELNEAGPSRNYLFELLVAVRFAGAGYEIDFGYKTDVVARKGDLEVFSECKRLSSEGKLKQNMKDAASQLRTAFTNLHIKPSGLIFIDVSSCVNPEFPLHFDSPAAALKAANSALNSFVTRNSQVIEKQNEEFLDISYATCFIAQLPIWTRIAPGAEDIGMYMATSLRVIAAKSINEEEFIKLNHMVSGFDVAMHKYFG